MSQLGWKEELTEIIQKICPIGKHFRLPDLYKFKDRLAGIHPDNHTIKESTRYWIRKLHSDGVVERVERGRYKRLK